MKFVILLLVIVVALFTFGKVFVPETPEAVAYDQAITVWSATFTVSGAYLLCPVSPIRTEANPKLHYEFNRGDVGVAIEMDTANPVGYRTFWVLRPAKNPF